MTKLTAEEAAHQIIALFNTSVLAEADAVLGEGIGRWLDKALAARSRMSQGEEVLLNIVLFVYNGGGSASLYDLTTLDATLMAQVLTTIQQRFVGFSS